MLRVSLLTKYCIFSFGFLTFFFASVSGIAQKNKLKDSSIVTGWEDGRVPEYSNAYTLHRHECLIQPLGISSFAFNNNLEISSNFLYDLFFPNLGLKYKIGESGGLTYAVAAGVASNPLGSLAAISLGTLGVQNTPSTIGSPVKDYQVVRRAEFLNFYISWQPVNYLTLSVSGGPLIANVSKGNPITGFHRVNDHGFLSGGEIDWMLDHRNCFTAKISMIHVGDSIQYIETPALFWTHAWSRFHLSAGLYLFFLSSKHDSKYSAQNPPIAPELGFYWIFNRQKKSGWEGKPKSIKKK